MNVVIWGHPLHSHTHSYIHAAFVRGFQYLGHNVRWISHAKDATGIQPETLFLTEGQVDKEMPKRADCRYVLHNCKRELYEHIPRDRILQLQVYAKTCLQWNPRKLNDELTYLGDHYLIQPWATDLLPHEIDLAWAKFPRARETHWVGSIGGGTFGNIEQVGPFKKACEERGIKFCLAHKLGFKENLERVRRSYLAPSIHGAWQVENGYVACRVFKNISYGQLGATNCAAANEAMHGMLICNTDTRQLFADAEPYIKDVERVERAMKLVRDKHTYVNRIGTILKVMGLESEAPRP